MKPFAKGILSVFLAAIFLVGCQTETEGQKEPERTSVCIQVTPSRISYKVGDKFDTTDLVVKAFYSDGTEEKISEFTTDPANNTVFDTEMDSKEIVVSAVVDGKTLTTSYIVSVSEKNSIIRTIKTKNVKVFADTISYNLDDSLALATTWVDQASSSSGSRAAGSSIALKKANGSLRKITDDGDEDVINLNSLSGEEIKILESTESEDDIDKMIVVPGEIITQTEVVVLEDGQSYSDIETDVSKVKVEVVELEDGFQLQPVRQVYQCPYTDIDEGQKGVYIAYASYTEWKYTDGNPAVFGSLVYVKPDGTSADIFVDYNNYKIVPAFAMKSSDDEEFLQFDEAGHMFVAAYDENGKISIYKYEPIGGDLLNVLPNIDGLSIRNYKVSNDGKWLFLNAMVKGTNNVYAIPTFRPEDYVTLYASGAEEYSVENVVVTNDRTVYFFVNDYAGGRRTSGLHKCKFNYATNSYSKADIETEITLPVWAFQEDLEKEFTKNGVIDYESLLQFIFSFCGASGEKEFRLDNAFAEYSQEKGTYDWYYGKLYTNKTDAEALKFIFESEDLAQIFYNYCYDDSRKDDGSYKGGKGRFPFERFVFKKGTDETAYTVSPAYYNTDFGSTDTTGGILLINNEGVFVLKPSDWNMTEGWFDCSKVVKVIDNNGNYVFETPDGLKHFECPAPRREYVYKDPTESDWYKKPFQTNADGIFIYDKTETQIWYYSNGVAKNLLANDSSAIEKINSFYADDDSITFNASYGASKFTHKIDIETRNLFDYKLSGDLTQIIEIDNSAMEAAKNTGDVKVSITIQEIADLAVIISPVNDGKIKITASKTYNEDGFEENFSDYKWTCLGKVLNTDNGKIVSGAYYITINVSDYVSGSYPILVKAKKEDGTYCSCFFNLIIE